MLIIIVSRGWHLSGTPPFRKETPKKERRRRSRRRGCRGRATIRKQSINPNISRKTDFWVSGCRSGGLDTRCALLPWASSSSLFLKEHVTPRGAAGQKKRFSLCILVNQRYSGESGRGQWQVVRWDGTGSVSLREETITPPIWTDHILQPVSSLRAGVCWPLKVQLGTLLYLSVLISAATVYPPYIRQTTVSSVAGEAGALSGNKNWWW